MKLIMDLKNVIHCNASSSAEWQLATFLLGRLETTTLPPDISLPRSKETVLPLMIMSLQQMPDCLGSGSFAIVHKATWFGVEVAKKTFYGPSSVDFFREVSILDGLKHPNIVSLLWSMTDGKKSHLVMELMEGDLFSLMQQRIEENGNQGCPFSIPEALDLILQIGEGMFYLHEKRIVHRDLKSRNILTRGGKVAKGNVKYLQVKVADFGLSKTKERSATYSDISLNVGTTRWMAPEVMRVGNHRGDDEGRKVVLKYPFKIDVYSFGMVCYEILTGEVPFSSLSHGEVKEAILSGERPPLPRECPYRLKTLIESCWSPEASARPSFGSICEELRDLKYANLQIYWKAMLYRQCPLEDIVTIDELVAKLSSPIADIQQSATNDIRLLTKKSFDRRIYIKEQEAMPLLVLLSYSRDQKTRKQAITTLTTVLVDDLDLDRDTSFRIDSLNELSLPWNTTLTVPITGSFIYEETYLGRAIGPVGEVLKFGRMKAREHAALALLKLSSDLGVDAGEKIRDSGAVSALVALLEDGSAEGKEYAAVVLCRMCRSFLELPSAVQAMVVPPLVNLIAHHSDGTLLDDAFRILVTLTKVREGLVAIVAVRPTSILVKFIASESRRNKDNAVLILRELCLHDARFIQEAREANVVESLTQHPRSSQQLARALLELLQSKRKEM